MAAAVSPFKKSPSFLRKQESSFFICNSWIPVFTGMTSERFFEWVRYDKMELRLRERKGRC
ncbi:MAG: hypothetical protein AMJ94_00555 [Deltaproteobacteria bacterium SM23_61]|nr:MAG: hypothetical protein AMJ94_00555 [Deltaproteobacteria bacterium SM23_61]